MSTGQENYVIATLSEDAFWSVNKAIGRTHGIEHAVLIAELVYKFKYWRERGQLDNARGFFYTSADIQKVLGVSERAAKRLTKSVQSTGFVKVKKRGQPAKNYWYLQFQAISDVLSQAETVPTGQAETDLSSEGETVPAITKKTDKENSIAAAACLPKTNYGKETKTKVKKTIDLSPIEPVLKILRETDKNADKSISLNLRNMIRNEFELNGEEFVCNAVRGRVAQAKATGKALYLSTFFDPDNAEWRSDCARVGEAAQNAPQGQETTSETASAVEAMHELMMSGNVT